MSGILNSLKSLASGSKTAGEDTNMRFSPTPVPGDSGFSQWRDAMKMVAKLPGGIPPEFRKKLWLALAEKHLQSKGVNWLQTERLCFNEWSNPDDNELGVQIVKDLHRTGCSLFCGAAGQENQALLKRVLLAYARWNKSVGYCQGFNMLAALILQVMDKSEIDSVKVMIYLIEGVLPESYFANNLRGLSVDMVVFRDLLRMRLPQLSKHLEALQNDAREGNSYEPPLTNVFTMQWFLTLFCNCLPQTTVLRVWDLIFLEGNEILLRTAIAIWEKLSDRILAVNSADEFYSIMGVLTREMLEFGLVDSNTLVKSIVAIGACAELNDMRDRYLYNITPWTQSVQTAAKKGLKLFYSDDDDVESDYDEKAAVTAVYGMSIGRKKERSMSGTVIQPYAHGHPDRERLALDISALKKQYAKLRERQRQAHIILQAACARQPMGQNTTSAPIAMNHLLLGKNAIVNARGRRLGPPKGAIPPVRTREPMKKQQQGETIHWKDTAKIRYPRRPSYVEENLDPKETFVPDSDSSSYSEDDSSSTSTELCDEPERMSDFDSDDKVGNIPGESEVRTTKELKNTINSEKCLPDDTIVTEDNLNRDKSEASVCVSSETKRQDNKRNDEASVNDEDDLFSEFKSSEKLDEFKSPSEENVTTVTNEADLCPRRAESAVKVSEIHSDIFANPVFYNEICKIQDTRSADSKDNYVEATTMNESTAMIELDVIEQTDKSKLDGLEENEDTHIDTITKHNAEAKFEVYKFEKPSDFNLQTPEKPKLCEEIMKLASGDNKFSSKTNLINTDISPLGKESEINYFDNSEASSSIEENMVENRRISNFGFKLDDQKNKRICDEFTGEESVSEPKRYFDIAPLTPIYNFETSLQNAEISSPTALFTSDNLEATANSNTESDIKKETIRIQHSPNFELTNIAITPEEDSISRITSIASDKNDKIQAMLNENSDILKGYQIGGEEKKNLEVKLDETNKVLVDKQERKENYLLEFDPEETSTVFISMDTPETSTKSYDFEHFLEEQVKLLKQNSSEGVPSPKEERSSDEKLRRHRSYEESTKNYMDRSTFYKQTSFDNRSSPIEEWTPYQFKESLSKDDEETQVNTRTEEIRASTLDTFEESLRNQKMKVDRKLDKSPLKDESCEEIVVKQEETPEWIPYKFEENKNVKHEVKRLDIKLNKYANTLQIFEDSGINEANTIKIDVKLAETPVTEEVSKEPVTEQPSIDLLSVDDSRLEAGRKHSARALKIMQENSLILHRILQHSKSSDKEDSEDELSRSPISKTFKSESLLSREERTDEDRSSRDGDEDLESGTEFSLSPAVLDEESDTFVRKSSEEKFSFEYQATDENVYETFSDKSRQIKGVSSFAHADETNSSEKRPSELFTLEKKVTNDKSQTEKPYKLSSDFERNEVDNIINSKDITSKQFRSENEEYSLEILPEISSYAMMKKLSAIESETHVTKRSTNKKLEKRYSSWHEEMSPDIPILSGKQFSSSFSFRSPEEEKSHLSTYSTAGIYTEDSNALYLQKSPEKITKISSSSEYNLDKYKLASYSENETTARNIETRNNDPIYQKEDTFMLSKGANDYVASSHSINEEENIDNNSTETFQSSAQSSSYSKAYSEFQYIRNRLTIDLPTPETSSPSHLSCLQFATDIPCTSKSLQFSPICVKDTRSPPSPSSNNNKYSINLPTLSAPKRTVKSPLSPVKSFNPFPVQPTTRQPKEVGVRLGLYKDLSPLKSPTK